MNWQLVSLDRVAAQPWRIGGGRTRELLAWPSALDWQVRLSVADVDASGPFSRFEGVERWFAVLEGDGVLLHVDGEAHRLTRGDEPLRFDGAATVECTMLGGATRDFNLMAAPGRANLRRVRGEETVDAKQHALLAFYTHMAPAQLATAGDVLQLPARHLAWCLGESAATVRFAASDGLWMEAQP